MEKLILNENNVQLQTEAKDWEEAVRIGAEMLVSQGCAEKSYVEGIISAIKELGPYIIVADGLAMPHTRPECGATGIGCSLITLKEPVYFDGDKEPVRVLICFSAVDSESHLDILKMIVGFVEKGWIPEIAAMKDQQELFDFLNKNSNA